MWFLLYLFFFHFISSFVAFSPQPCTLLPHMSFIIHVKVHHDHLTHVTSIAAICPVEVDKTYYKLLTHFLPFHPHPSANSLEITFHPQLPLSLLSDSHYITMLINIVCGVFYLGLFKEVDIDP